MVPGVHPGSWWSYQLLIVLSVFFFIVRAVLNILDNILDLVATVSTLAFGGTCGFPPCSFVMRITTVFLVGRECMLFPFILSH